MGWPPELGQRLDEFTLVSPVLVGMVGNHRRNGLDESSYLPCFFIILYLFSALKARNQLPLLDFKYLEKLDSTWSIILIGLDINLKPK